MHSFLEKRSAFLFIALFPFALVGVALFLEHAFDQLPCNLCMLQRLLYVMIGVGSLLAYFTLNDRTVVRFATLFMAFFSLLGVGVAARHVSLLWFPVAVTDSTKCLVSFGSFFDEAIDSLGGRGNCLQETMHILGLNIPEWSFVGFSVLLVVSFFLARRAWVNARAGAEGPKNSP